MRANRRFFLFSILISFSFSIECSGYAHAQSLPPVQTIDVNSNAGSNEPSTEKEIPIELQILNSIEQEIKKKKGKDIYERSSVPSLVFTSSQYALLREARIGFNTRSPSLQELAKIGDPNDPNYRPPASIRDIKLGGISFNTPDDWTIWLNNSRVTPDALPSEALDLRVYKDFIELKWFDVLTNQIYPVRLRTNQKFNIDSRIFLPG